MPGSIDNRRFVREHLRVPVRIEVLHADEALSKIFLGFTSNVSSHGLAINVPPQTLLKLDASILVSVDGRGPSRSGRFPAKLSWQADSLLGLEFISGDNSVYEILRKSAMTLETQTPFLKQYFPYVAGESVDTRKYEFFPYAEKLLTDYAKTRDLMVQLKKGLIPPEAANYFFAQYAIADSQLNYSAVLSANEAFREFRTFSVDRRLHIIDDVRELLDKEKHNLIELMIIEGHPIKTAESEFEAMRVCISEDSLGFFEQEMETLARSGNKTMIGVRRPRGVACIHPPKSAASAVFMAALALLAGNTLVLDPPANMPISSVYLWKNIFGAALNLNGAPRGTLNIVMGDSNQFMEEWSANPLVKNIFFFGGGVQEHSGRSMIGSCPMLIWKDADLRNTVDSLMSCFDGQAQTAPAPNLVFVHQDAYDPFISALLPKMSQLQPGLPRDPESVLAPAINEMSQFFETLDRFLKHGGKLLTGGYRINHRGARDPEGLFIAPTVLEIPIEAAVKSQIVPGIISSLLLPVVKVRGGGLKTRDIDGEVYDAMVRLMSSAPSPSRISVWVRDSFHIRKFIDDLDQSGSLRFNSLGTDLSIYRFSDGRTGTGGGLFPEMSRVWEKASELQWISVTRP